MEYLIEKIAGAISIAVKRDMGGSEDNVVEIDPANPRYLKVVWGKGYKLEEMKK